MWRLAFRNLLRQPQRSLATALGIALGVAAVLATLSMGSAIQRGIRRSLQEVTGQADHLVVPSGAARAIFSPSSFHNSIANADIEALTIDALPVLEQPVRFGTEGFRLQGLGNTDGLLLSGRILDDPRSRSSPLQAGDWAVEGSMGVMLSADLVRRWQLDVGDNLTLSTLLGARDFVVSGVVEESGSSVLLMQLEDMQQALRLEDKVSYMALYGALPADFATILPPSLILTKPSANGAYAVDGLIELLANGLRLLAMLLLLLSGLLAYNTFAVSRLERQRELSLLRMLCLTQRQVRQLNRLEAIFLGIFGGLLGLLLSLAFSWLLLYGYGRLLSLPLLGGFELSWHFWLALPLSILIALLAVAGQRQEASPLAMRRRQEDDATVAPWRYGLGFVLLIGGITGIFLPLLASNLGQIVQAIASSILLMLALPLLSPLIIQGMLWLSRPLRGQHHLLRLSYDFSSRSKGRNAVALSTVALGISLILMVGALVAGFDKTIVRWVSSSVSGDIFINTPLGVPADFIPTALQEVEGLQELSPVAIATVRAENLGARGRNLMLLLVEPYRFDPNGTLGSFWYVSDAARAYAGLARGELIISSTMAQRFGLQVGGSLQLRTRAGQQNFTIAGTIVDFTAGGESMVVSYDLAEELGVDSPRILVGQVQGDAQKVSEAIQARFSDLSLEINNGQYYRRRVLATSRRIFGATYSLLLLALLLSALAVSNTLAMNLKRRQHDLASLRVLGLSKKALARLVLLESIWIVLPAGMIGLLYGWLLSLLVSKSVAALSDFTIAATLPWWLLLLALLLSPVVALLAALAPARVAAKLEPVVALREAQVS